MVVTSLRPLIFLLCGSLLSCASSKSQGSKPGTAAGTTGDGELALALGDPVKAEQILASIAKDDPTYEYAQELLKDAESDTRAVVKRWLDEIDTLIAFDKLKTARRRCAYLLNTFPLQGKLRARVERKRDQVDKRIKTAIDSLAAVGDEAREFLLSNDLKGAVRSLESSLDLAWDLDPKRAVVWQRIVAATDVRIEVMDNGSGRRRRRAARRKRGATGPVEATFAVAPEPEPDAAEIAALVKKAKAFQRSRAYFRAITIWDSVLNKDPQNADAFRSLKALERKREQLVAEYLAKANQRFLKQDLKGAVPYYEKVLLLDPGNKKAIEGMRMHENLERIRKQKKRR